MPRLRDERSGAVVSVPEEKVQRLGPNWVRIDGSSAAEDAASVFAEMTVADLSAEIDRRNEGRDDDAQIVPEGAKKAYLVAALIADDAATEPEAATEPDATN